MTITGCFQVSRRKIRQFEHLIEDESEDHKHFRQIFKILIVIGSWPKYLFKVYK